MSKERPAVCLDSRCTPLYSHFEADMFEQGYSFDCVGRLEEPHEFRWRDVVHVNTHCHCIYTPLKGINKFLITVDDAFSTYSMMAHVLEDAKGLKCCECGSTSRIATSYVRVDDKLYCNRCTVRLGIQRWDEDENVWVYTGRITKCSNG